MLGDAALYFMSIFTKSKLENALFLVFFALLIIFGATYFIHSSELWSVYIAKNLFTADYFSSVSLKPLFHFLLYLFHLIPLTDVEHLHLVKSVFAILGSLQFILIWKIFSKHSIVQNKILSHLVFFTFAICSSVFLQNYFRIRSDQVCATLFLFFIYINASKKLSLKYNFVFLAIYPLIAIKGILFSLLQLCHILISYKKEVLLRKYIHLSVLALIALLLSVINFSWDGVIYFLQTTNSFAESYASLKNWILGDFLIVAVSLFSLFYISYQKWTLKIFNINISILSIFAVIIVILFPQKHTYFIASFVPLLVLNSMLFAIYIINNYFKSEHYIKAVSLLFLLFLTFNCFQLYNTSVYRSNFSQFKFIRFIAPIIALNNLSYIDGIGALPRANNLNCFVSPNDTISNNYCLDLVLNGKPDIVILSSRLMSLIGPDEFLKNYYSHFGYNIFFKKDFDSHFTAPKDLSPALLVFGFEW